MPEGGERMKPLKLTLQAFESYLAKQTIDFEKLSSAGIFLIWGNTGSGKTVIFDAIVYALYGKLSEPQREDLDQIKTRDASSDVLSYVTLEFEEKGKKYRITRCPSQLLMSKRKEIFQTPRVTLEFLDETDKAPITSIKEIDTLIPNIIGLDKDQFFQVSMIAQGDFSKILTSDTKTRQEILRKLFNTTIYQTFTSKLKDKTNESMSETKEATISLDQVFNSLDYLNEDKEKIVSITDDESRMVLLKDCSLRYQTLLDEAQEKKKQTSKRIETLNAEKKDCLIYQNNLLALQSEEAKLADCEKKVEALTKEKKDLDSKKKEIDEKDHQQILLNSKLKNYQQLDELKDSLFSLKKQLDSAQASLKTKEANQVRNNQDKEALLEEQQDLEKELQKEVSLNEALTNIKNQVDEASDQKTIVDKEKDELSNLSLATNELVAKQSIYDDSLKKANDLETGYYASMSGILASNLIEGKPCPVCGSLSHPHPNMVKENDVTKEEFEQAKTDRDQALKNLNKASESLSNINALIEKDLQGSTLFYKQYFSNIDKGDYSSVIDSLRLDSEIFLKKSLDEKHRLEALNSTYLAKHQRADQIAMELDKLSNSTSKIQDELMDLRSLESRLEATYQNNQKSLDSVAKDLEYPSKEEALKVIHSLSYAVDTYKESVEKNNQDNSKALADKATARGLLASLKKQTESYKGRDIDIIEGSLSAENNLLSQEESQINLLFAALASLNKGLDRYQKLLNSSAKGKAEYSRLLKLSYIFSADTSARNGLDMDRGLSLESYVLSYYLDKILEKASLRFRNMTEGKYLLERRTDSDKGRSQQGLDIDVFDIVNGTKRKASTLSGGETFMASLSLALGLSDFVKETVGNKRIEILFIDEGFGTLDSESLAKVVEVLTSLSEQESTSIGLISHVEELKQFFSAQISVVKDRQGHSLAHIQDRF